MVGTQRGWPASWDAGPVVGVVTEATAAWVTTNTTSAAPQAQVICRTNRAPAFQRNSTYRVRRVMQLHWRVNGAVQSEIAPVPLERLVSEHQAVLLRDGHYGIRARCSTLAAPDVTRLDTVARDPAEIRSAGFRTSHKHIPTCHAGPSLASANIARYRLGSTTSSSHNTDGVRL